MDVVPVNVKHQSESHSYGSSSGKNRLACRIRVKQNVDVQFYNDANTDLVTAIIKELSTYVS